MKPDDCESIMKHMRKYSIVRLAGLASIIGAVGLIIWWFLMPILLPVSDAAENFMNMILHPFWLPVNMMGLIAILILTLGFPGFYLARSESFGKWGFTGSVLAVSGLILYTCIQYYETLIWPAAASQYPDLVQVEGALVSGNAGVVAGLIVSGLILSFGYVLFGLMSIKKHTFPKVSSWLIIFGAPLFGVGVVFPVRTIGIILFCTATIWNGIHIRKTSEGGQDR